MLRILSEKEKEKILGKLNEQFGIREIKEKIVMLGKEKMFLFSGSLSENEINKLRNKIFIERVGFYFGKFEESTGDIRLSIDATQYLKEQISKNVFEINEKDAEEWMKGRELLIKTGKKGFVVIKHKNDFLGTGKASENKIGNFIPKNRRLKEKV